MGRVDSSFHESHRYRRADELRDGKEFRGGKPDALDRHDEGPGLLVDTLDVGLYRVVDTRGTSDSDTYHYSDNESLWRDLLTGQLSHGMSVRLEQAQVLEWLPAAPGRYFTAAAADAREESEYEWDVQSAEYRPSGKFQMVMGGVGSVRLAAREVCGDYSCFFGATFNGISHQGIPIIVPVAQSREILKQIRKHGAGLCTITGTLWPLPTDLSPLEFDRGVSKYYLIAESVEVIGPPSLSSTVTIAIAYGMPDAFSGVMSDIDQTPQYGWSFASFNPAEGSASLDRAVQWLKEYAHRHRRPWVAAQAPPAAADELFILGDFDETHAHFGQSVAFPLPALMRGKADMRVLNTYANCFNITVKETNFMGDYIAGNTGPVNNRSTLVNVSQSVQAGLGPDGVDALRLVTQHVEKADDPAATAMLNSFVTELNQPERNKPTLRKLWDGLVKVLPDIAKLGVAVEKITHLFI